MLSCVAIFIIPFYRGRTSQSKHLWLVKKQYQSGSDGQSRNLSCHWITVLGHSNLTFCLSYTPSRQSQASGIPFLVPHRSMLLMVSEFLSNACLLSIAILNLHNVSSRGSPGKILIAADDDRGYPPSSGKSLTTQKTKVYAQALYA